MKLKMFVDAMQAIENDRKLTKEIVVSALEEALIKAYRKHIEIPDALVRVDINENSGAIKVFQQREVVENVEDENTQISLTDAKEIDEDVELDDEVKIEVTPENFGRIAAQSAKQVITQRIREAERKMVLDEFLSKKGTLITGIIQRRTDRAVIVNIGKTDAIMPSREQIPGEYYKPGNRIRVFVLDVKETSKLPQVIVSQAHAEIVRELFELEVPEIEDGIVEIKSIAREAGFRTKLAVWSNDPSVDSVGACIGPRGTRIQTIVSELKNEKIDIVRYSEDPVEYIVNALSPARIVSVDILADEDDRHEAFVIVPDDQLSLAIGREGQNVRLAHRLTNWKIDIKSESQAREIESREQSMAENQYADEEVNNEEYIEEDEPVDEIAMEAIEETNQTGIDEEDQEIEEPNREDSEE